MHNEKWFERNPASSNGSPGAPSQGGGGLGPDHESAGGGGKDEAQMLLTRRMELEMGADSTATVSGRGGGGEESLR